ncbi:MAG TPA: acetyl-CoA decarbonylase/synthase complex subunit gamma [Planctomycetota bacterium]|nr:acetyl-CoA decarbonylase/synthase complex subunit gamma [Planctomycetota bacterium]
MALTGLQIFKLLPGTNCKKCGKPTCLAFAMLLAQKKADLSECPDASEQAKETLASASAPPIRLVKFGVADAEVQVGQETAIYRHDDKFYNPTVVAVTADDTLSEADLKKRLEAINGLVFERVGQTIAVNAVAVRNVSGNAADFAKAAETAAGLSKRAMILVSTDPAAMKAAVEKCKDKKPLLWGAVKGDTFEPIVKCAKESGCPLVVSAETLDDLAELTEQAKTAGVQDLVLVPVCEGILDLEEALVRIRTLALKKTFRPLGYPTLALVANDDPHAQCADASALVCKFAGIVVMTTVEPWAVLPVLTVRMNIFTDPQKPVQVEPKLYAVGEPDETSPLLFTTNFSLTYYSVENDVEASRVPSWLLAVDTEGTSVLTAYSGDKLNEEIVKKAMDAAEVEKKVKHRKLIIPGYVAVMSGKLEETTGWEIMVGPRESSVIPKYLQEVWK